MGRMWSASLGYGTQERLLGCPTPMVVSPCLCCAWGSPCAGRLGGQGRSYPLVHLPAGPPGWVDLGTSLVIFGDQESPLYFASQLRYKYSIRNSPFYCLPHFHKSL